MFCSASRLPRSPTKPSLTSRIESPPRGSGRALETRSASLDERYILWVTLSTPQDDVSKLLIWSVAGDLNRGLRRALSTTDARTASRLRQAASEERKGFSPNVKETCATRRCRIAFLPRPQAPRRIAQSPWHSVNQRKSRLYQLADHLGTRSGHTPVAFFTARHLCPTTVLDIRSALV